MNALRRLRAPFVGLLATAGGVSCAGQGSLESPSHGPAPPPAGAHPPPARSPTPSAPRVRTLDDLEGLQSLLASRCIVLFSRGHAPAAAAAAASAFMSAARADDSGLTWWRIDDASSRIPAVAVSERVGVRLDEPFVAILDPSGDRWLMPASRYGRARPLDAIALASFVRDVSSGSLAPALLGLPRPPRDESTHCSALTEVVTDSIRELVSDCVDVDVLLCAYTPRCPACKAFAPRLRMLAQLCAAHAPRLRVAQVDTLNNDVPRGVFREKWTPALRLFPAAPRAAVRDSTSCPTRHSILLVDESAVATGGGVAAAPDPSPPPPPRIFLPTLPALLAFISTHTQGRGVAAALSSPEVLAKAEALEAEAAELEAAYDAVLNYVSLMKAWEELPEELNVGKTRRQTKAETSAALRAAILSAHSFIVEEAVGGCVDRALDRLDAVAALVEAEGISRALAAAAASAESQASAATSPHPNR